MTPIRGLLFDKDGTLFDFGATWEGWATAFLSRLTQGDRHRAQTVGAQIGFNFHRGKFHPDSVVIAGTPDEVAGQLLPQFPAMSAVELTGILNEEAARAPQREAVPLRPLLQALRGRGLSLGVATNDAIGPALAHLDRARVRDLFDFIAGSDSGHGAKPEPGQMRAFAAQIGARAAEIVMIGDSTHDLQAGRAAGMRCIGVLTGPATHGNLAPLADTVLPDIGHLPAWLDRQAAGTV